MRTTLFHRRFKGSTHASNYKLSTRARCHACSRWMPEPRSKGGGSPESNTTKLAINFKRTARLNILNVPPKLSPKCDDERQEDEGRHGIGSKLSALRNNARRSEMKSSLATAIHCGDTRSVACHAQFGSGIVYDPTQSAHAIEQISQGQQIFTNSVRLADNAIATYNLAHEMSLAPQILYQPFLSPSTYWMALNQAANTYGNSQPWTNSVNTGVWRRHQLPTGDHSSHRPDHRIQQLEHAWPTGDRRTGSHGRSRTIP